MPGRLAIGGLVGSLCALAGCSRGEGAPDAGPPGVPSSVAASSAAVTSASAEPPPPLLVPLDEPGRAAPAATGDPAFGAPLPPAEARRVSLKRLADEPALAAQEAVLRAHFGAWTGLEAQVVPLVGDRRAVLLTGPASERNPLLLVLDGKGALLWSKERPLAGTRMVVTELALVAGPRGEVGLLWFDIPSQVVALRKWAWDGVVLADFEVAEVELCEALSALYWPGRGWLAAASVNGAARLQLLDERGRRAFGPTGVELPWKARPSAPAALAVDGEMSAIVFQVGDRPGEGGATPDRLLAMRFDTLGMPIWASPLDLGAAAGAPRERPSAAVRAEGQVRATLGKALSAIVTSGGSILTR